MASQHSKEAHTPQMFDYAAASEMTSLSLGTLYALVHRKQIPHVRLGPRLVRFCRSDLARWIEARKVPVRHTAATRPEAAAASAFQPRLPAEAEVRR